jgi:hypothetical protein
MWLVKSAMDSGSECIKSTKSTGRLSHACGLESELEDEAYSVALVSTSDDASVKLDETLDSSSCQSQQKLDVDDLWLNLSPMNGVVEVPARHTGANLRDCTMWEF